MVGRRGRRKECRGGEGWKREEEKEEEGEGERKEEKRGGYHDLL